MGGQNNTGSARVEILKLLQSRAILRRVVDKTATGVGLSNDSNSRAKQHNGVPRRIARNQPLSTFLLPSTSQQRHPVRRQSAKRTQRLLAASKAKTTFFFFLSLRSDVETSLDKNLAVSFFFFFFLLFLLPFTMCRIWLTSVLGRKKRAPRLPSPPKICYFASFYFSRLPFTARVYGWLPYDTLSSAGYKRHTQTLNCFLLFFSSATRT